MGRNLAISAQTCEWGYQNFVLIALKRKTLTVLNGNDLKNTKVVIPNNSVIKVRTVIYFL